MFSYVTKMNVFFTLQESQMIQAVVNEVKGMTDQLVLTKRSPFSNLR